MARIERGRVGEVGWGAMLYRGMEHERSLGIYSSQREAREVARRELAALDPDDWTVWIDRGIWRPDEDFGAAVTEWEWDQDHDSEVIHQP